MVEHNQLFEGLCRCETWRKACKLAVTLLFGSDMRELDISMRILIV